MRALVRREYLIRSSYRGGMVLDALFGVVSLVIYLFISRTFGGAPDADLAGAPGYFEFAAAGVALAIVVQAASSRVAQRVREDQRVGSLEALASQPVSPGELALGLAGFHFAFAAARAALYLLLAGLLLGADLSGADWVGLAVVLPLAGAALLPVGIVLAALVVVARRAELVVGLVTVGLAVGGGAYFPVSVLPHWLAVAAEGLPTHHAFEAVRAALYRGDAWGSEAALLAAFALVGTPLAVLAFRAALAGARRHGSLAAA